LSHEKLKKEYKFHLYQGSDIEKQTSAKKERAKQIDSEQKKIL